jgi:hypothetical protein
MYKSETIIRPNKPVRCPNRVFGGGMIASQKQKEEYVLLLQYYHAFDPKKQILRFFMRNISV